ncbi:hypothetical protein B4U84_09430 [Westiellopsis prolifica IICB1]|nr:hypothetical protein B4U84_09430 [Westiellopsis prolifica IICB1]
MSKQACLQSDQQPKFEDQKFMLDNFDIQDIHNQKRNSSFDSQMHTAFDTEKVARPKSIDLNIEDLKCFEVVKDQYQKLGVVFDNCIAIQPSNPAFPTKSGLLVLMGAPKGGYLEATFLQPVQFVSALVTSSQRLVLSAYNRDRQLLTQTALPGANLANSDAALPPNTRLSLTVDDIYSITFCAFDGQFTIDDFSFCFES